MKILPHNISANTEQQKTGANQGTAGNGFRDILEQTITTSSKPEEGTMTLPPLQNIPTIPFDQIQGVDMAQGIGRVERFLDLLEDYRNKLGDPGSTLKDFSPLVSGMEDETAKIVSLLDSLPDGDKLKDILNRAVVTATVEAIKFNRGDYL